MNEIDIQKRNARENFVLGSNTTYISLTGVGVSRWGYLGNTNFRFGVGGNANFLVFRYQHVAIPNAKFWCWGV